MRVAEYPPVTLSMPEFRSEWEPRGWKLLVIGPTATWRQDWGEWEAIRDIVQNSLDECEAYSWGYDDRGLWIADTGKGVSVADFLLGPPKLKPDWARGRFGEGMKIASLTLIRKGYRVHIETVGKEIWIVFVRQRVDSEADTLAALWQENGATSGTRFHIIGYFGSAFEDRFTPNIPKGYILHRGASPITEPVQRYNALISSPAGRIYARDIYMMDIDSPWSYNLWGFDMAPDRHGPKNESDVWIDMGRLWCTVKNRELLIRLLGMMKAPPEEATYEAARLNFTSYAMGKEPTSGKYYSDLMVENGAYWRIAWESKFGKWAVVETRPDLRPTVEHLGYTSIPVRWEAEAAISRVIKTDLLLVTESQKELSAAKVIPDERLTATQLAHLRLARGIALETPYVSPPPGGVHAAIIPAASERARTAGMYDRTLRQILVSPDHLERGTKAVDVVIHELAHHVSQAEDGTEEHNRAMTAVAANVVFGTARGVYDQYKEGVVW